MNKIYIQLLMVLSLLMCFSCQQADDFVEDSENEPQVGCEVSDFLMEDAMDMTRSSYIYEKSGNMRFDWQSGDRIGVFNVSVGENAEVFPFSFREGSAIHEGNMAKARFINSNYSFNHEQYWVAYCPYLCNNTANGRTKVTKYNDINLTYTGQNQLVNATDDGKNPKELTEARRIEVETQACKHIGEYDYLISGWSQPDETEFTTFHFQHVGGVVRFYLRFPEGSFGGAGKVGTVKSMRVVCKENKFASDARLAIKPYSATGSSYEVLSATKTDNQLLTFGQNGTGVTVPDHAYFIAYMQFFPFELDLNSCKIYFTVLVDGVERYFVTKETLPSKDTVAKLGAGQAVQWSTGDFFEPIELTATLTPWQDIYGGTISTGDE